MTPDSPTRTCMGYLLDPDPALCRGDNYRFITAGSEVKGAAKPQRALMSAQRPLTLGGSLP
jgi:hypothetical protein